ncbi:MAG: transketolase [Bacillales bacterium]|jgi:transketolase|nr:transketolase [Bacillales bacterium]
MDFKGISKQIRKDTLWTIGNLGVGHIGGSLSIIEVLVLLYYKYLNIDPSLPNKEGRDRLIVSKGHAGPAVYAVLANKGYFPKELLGTLNKNGTLLPSHCDMRLAGVDMTTGSLGQGFSCAVGIAKASKLSNDGAKIYSIIGDGESQEGQIWEAAMFAGSHKLDNFIAILDKNNYQIDGAVDVINSIDPIGDKFKAFNFEVIEVKDGNDVDQIDEALSKAKEVKGKPTMLILHTVKGKGVKSIENAGAGNHNMKYDLNKTAEFLKEVEEN